MAECASKVHALAARMCAVAALVLAGSIGAALSATAANASCDLTDAGCLTSVSSCDSIDVSGIQACEADYYDNVEENTGDCPTVTCGQVMDDPTDYQYLNPGAAVAAKAVLEKNALTQVAVLQGGLEPMTQSCPDGDCLPNAETDATALGHLSQQETPYTCAPASVRSTLADLGVVKTEGQVQYWIKATSASGSQWDIVEAQLNKFLDNAGKSTRFVGSPEHDGLEPNEIMARVASDVHYGKHPAIMNVNQYRLSYWGGSTTKTGRHYLTAYGYDVRNARIVLGDVAGGGHFGSHTVSLTQVHIAELANKGLVIW